MPRRSLKSIANMVAAMKFGRNATNIANAKNAKIGLNNPGFKDAQFLRAKVSWFQFSKIKISMIPYYQVSISCFLIDRY